MLFSLMMPVRGAAASVLCFLLLCTVQQTAKCQTLFQDVDPSTKDVTLRYDDGSFETSLKCGLSLTSLKFTVMPLRFDGVLTGIEAAFSSAEGGNPDGLSFTIRIHENTGATLSDAKLLLKQEGNVISGSANERIGETPILVTYALDYPLSLNAGESIILSLETPDILLFRDINVGGNGGSMYNTCSPTNPDTDVTAGSLFSNRPSRGHWALRAIISPLLTCGTSVLLPPTEECFASVKCCDAATNAVGPECCGSVPFDPNTLQCCPGNILLESGEVCPEVCLESCTKNDSEEVGISVCTSNNDDFHNVCASASDSPLVLGESMADGRPIVQCGCCDDDQLGLDNIKRSKKGAHCDAEYPAEVRRRRLGQTINGQAASKVSRRGGADAH